MNLHISELLEVQQLMKWMFHLMWTSKYKHSRDFRLNEKLVVNIWFQHELLQDGGRILRWLYPIAVCWSAYIHVKIKETRTQTLLPLDCQPQPSLEQNTIIQSQLANQWLSSQDAAVWEHGLMQAVGESYLVCLCACLFFMCLYTVTHLCGEL